MASTFVRSGKRGCTSSRGPSSLQRERLGIGDGQHGVRVADRDEAVGDARVRRAAILLRALERRPPEAHRDAAVVEHAGVAAAGARAHAQLAASRGARRRRATAMRVPLPEISAIEPSRLCTTTATSSPSSDSSSTPSAPSPSAKSQSRRARAGVIGQGGSSTTRKWLPSACHFATAWPNGNDQRGCRKRASVDATRAIASPSTHSPGWCA